VPLSSHSILAGSAKNITDEILLKQKSFVETNQQLKKGIKKVLK
jgi:hypothetical protein